MYDSILIPFDGSDEGELAVEHGIELASALGSTVHALYVIDLPGAPRTVYVRDDEEEMREEYHAYGEEVTNEVCEAAADAGVDCVTAIRSGSVAEEIVDYAEDEDLDVIEALRAGEDPPEARNANLLHSTTVDLQGVRFAGLSGNYAPTQYQKDRQHLHDDRRRHFVRNDVRRAKCLSDVDVLLTHEAPNGLLQYEHYDPGCDQVDDLLDALDPDLCLVGHHHEHLEMTYGSTRVVGLDAAWRSYYELDTTDLTLERHETPDG